MMQSVALPPPFLQPQSQVHRSDPQPACADQDVRHQAAARLVAIHAQVDVLDPPHRPARQKHVAVGAFIQKPIVAGGVVHLEQPSDRFALGHAPAASPQVVHFLQRDQVGLDRPDNARDTMQVDTPVAAVPEMDVVRHHGQWGNEIVHSRSVNVGESVMANC